jgi:ATP-binding cassette subfamily F protein 3
MIQFAGVTKNYGSKVLYANASFQINPGEKIGLVGPNGAGKTTVFRLIAGEQSPDDGRVVKVGKPKIGYFSQQIEEMRGRSALQEVIAAVGDAEHLQKRLKEIEA